MGQQEVQEGVSKEVGKELEQVERWEILPEEES